MPPPRPLLLALTVAFGAAASVPSAAPAASDVPGYFLNMLMWSGDESERYHRSPLVPAALTAASSSLAAAACPAPFLPVMSQCFWSSAQYKLSWDDARDFCQQMGGDLAEPLHLNALMVHLQDRYPSAKVFHLGATDLEQEGNWTYISGRPVDPRGWMPGEPNDTAHAQNCLNLCFQGCRASYPPLNDQQCHAKFHFVCEFSVVRE
ncbi:perlucin [Penaeus vannamei]|uniref:perlucin n=1 Tax=Penaeus vannamei TaxID=6689 RepID=UPI00387F73BA